MDQTKKSRYRQSGISEHMNLMDMESTDMPISQSIVDNLKYISNINLRKHIPQGIQRDIINRNKNTISRLSEKNHDFIKKQKKKELELPKGALQ
jgi:hypothetical protein